MAAGGYDTDLEEEIERTVRSRWPSDIARIAPSKGSGKQRLEKMRYSASFVSSHQYRRESSLLNLDIGLDISPRVTLSVDAGIGGTVSTSSASMTSST
jgi:hypothetical protein